MTSIHASDSEGLSADGSDGGLNNVPSISDQTTIRLSQSES
jgi:hypothetical protein